MIETVKANAGVAGLVGGLVGLVVGGVVGFLGLFLAYAVVSAVLGGAFAYVYGMARERAKFEKPVVEYEIVKEPEEEAP